ncbi:MAG: hypothetical protein OXC37_03315 [Bdellovibrionaceae bacterium]|nr:hypothetical protein [Pseudobdellovibrionaceae bacterium]
MEEFKKRLSGKWVLAGEYSVLRSSLALVYPLDHYYIDFYYKETEDWLVINRKGDHKAGLDFAVTPLLNRTLKALNKQKEDLKGHLVIEGNLPFGAGLGASAVLCAGMSHLCLYKNWINKNQLNSFATSLEDFFHGKSSGMDVAVVLKKKAILYQKSKTLKVLDNFKHRPLLYLSYSGGRASTSVGVSKVRKLFDENWTLAEEIDKQMNQSAEICLQALKEEDKEKSLSLLKSALNLGYDSFKKWKLISYDLEQHIRILKKEGALAVKPTGSGLGGYVISLWDRQPPKGLQLIALQI